MKSTYESWSRAMDDIDARFVEATAKPPRVIRGKRSVWWRWGAIAACTALLVTAITVGFIFFRSHDPQNQNEEIGYTLPAYDLNWQAPEYEDALFSLRDLRNMWNRMANSGSGGADFGAVLGEELKQQYAAYCQIVTVEKESELPLKPLPDLTNPSSVLEHCTQSVTLISLEEAEILLSQGCVLGGHTCPDCREKEKCPNFMIYQLVGLEYRLLYSYDRENGNEITDTLPFYAFYKYLGKDEAGMSVYGKLYVPAFQVSGLEAYWQSQNHGVT